MRIDPAAGAEHFKTYQMIAPVSTHFRTATCKEVECAGYVNGWRTMVEHGSAQAQYIRAKSGRHFTETRNGDMAVFTFPPGQMCFRAADHRVSLEREPVYIVRGGDHRGNPRGTAPIVHASAENWVDDFATHQDGIARRIERG